MNEALREKEKWEDKLEIVASIVASRRPDVVQSDVIIAAKSFYAKLLAAHNYKPTSSLTSPTLLVKAESTAAAMDASYHLDEMCSGDALMVVCVSGDHQTFIQSENCSKVAETVSTWLKENQPSE